MLGERIPITKMKSMQRTLTENNLLRSFPEQQSYTLYQKLTLDQNFSSHPGKNLMDVSALGEWCSTAPLVFWSRIEAHLLVPGGMLGLGLLQEAETVGNRDPIPRGEGTQILNFWSVLTGTSYDQVAGKHPFMYQRCGISLRKIVLSEISEPLSYR